MQGWAGCGFYPHARGWRIAPAVRRVRITDGEESASRIQKMVDESFCIGIHPDATTYPTVLHFIWLKINRHAEFHLIGFELIVAHVPGCGLRNHFLINQSLHFALDSAVGI